MSTKDPFPPRHYDLRLGGCQVVVVATIQGLAGERDQVQAGWDRFLEGPEAVALGVPPEDITNLRRMGREGVESFMSEDLDTGSYEEAILPQLARFGDIAMPPDDLLYAERRTRETGRDLIGLDLDDEAHADLYVKEVTGFQMIRGQMKQKRLVAKKAARATSPEELMLMWDAAYTRIGGYARFEAGREAHMAKGIQAAARDRRSLLVVLPYARAAGVIAALDEHR